MLLAEGWCPPPSCTCALAHELFGALFSPIALPEGQNALDAFLICRILARNS